MVESNIEVPQHQQNPFPANVNLNANAPVNTTQQHHHHKKITEGEADLYLDQYNFTTTAAIVGSVDRKVFVLLRDGKMLFGVLRTFDQYANLILEHCVERIYFTEKNKYAEEYKGLFMVRGENVVMLGEVDIDKEDQPLETMERIPFRDALKAKKIYDESRFKQETIKGRQLARYGILYDFHKSDMY
ncbi:Sm-like protein [Zygosaccharomyces mellis]|uniref:U6 snRNA-associated Sm-like protein LSm1 n=1 Tax=Zygosaccharomyces mellis TaxID=42258 RepID=A0A4C2E471_9SACH|nr:Sm-like protein [Zygosaccharomyces mellis]